MSHIFDSKKCLCQHEKLLPLISRNREFISEKMYGDIENIVQQDSYKYITAEVTEGLSTHKLTKYEIEYDMFVAKII